MNADASANSQHKSKNQHETNVGGQFAGFLFDADHPSLANGNYASPCEQRLLNALLMNDGSVLYPIRILRGDLLPHTIATRLKALNIPLRNREKNSYSFSRTEHVDIRSFATIIGDVCDSLEGSATTADLVKLPSLLGRKNIFCLTVNPLNDVGLRCIDCQLHGFPSYIGAVALDAGNPAHIELFSRLLLDCVWVEDGAIFASRWDTDEGVYEFGLHPQRDFKVIEVPYWDFRKMAPPRPTLMAMSARGMISAQRLQAATAPTHLEQVAGTLAAQTLSKAPPFPIDLKIELPAEEQMFIPVSKLIEYALNDKHDKGKHKAKLFSELMGIGKNEWRFLAYQIKDALVGARLEKIEATQYGIQYRAQMEVVGLNGRVMTIETRWIIRQDEPAQLSTAFVAEKEKQRSGAVASPPWVPLSNKGDERWAAIFKLASTTGVEVARRCVPKPLKIEGFPVIMDGECGGAFVRLDGRSAFAKWLYKSNLASRTPDVGMVLSSRPNTQSVEREKAYCEAFVRVLWLNGIEGAKVESYLS